jgi:hypothetical protein
MDNVADCNAAANKKTKISRKKLREPEPQEEIKNAIF